MHISTDKTRTPDFSHLSPDLVIVSKLFISHSPSVYSRSVSRGDGFQSDCFTDMRNSAGGMFSPRYKSLAKKRGIDGRQQGCIEGGEKKTVVDIFSEQT